MKVILDTSFILSCLRNKIDFISQLEAEGFKVILPREVFQELKDLNKNSKLSHADRIAINLALEMFEKIKVDKMTLGQRRTDEGLIEKGKEGYYIASLDAGIKRAVPNRVVISEAKKGILIERD